MRNLVAGGWLKVGKVVSKDWLGHAEAAFQGSLSKLESTNLKFQ